jgi:hypothetical protein
MLFVQSRTDHTKEAFMAIILLNIVIVAFVLGAILTWLRCAIAKDRASVATLARRQSPAGRTRRQFGWPFSPAAPPEA